MTDEIIKEEIIETKSVQTESAADESSSKAKKENKKYVSAVGRRKSAIARVRLYSSVPQDLKFGEIVVKKGDILVNEKTADKYFSTAVNKVRYEQPFILTETLNKISVTIKVSGGGLSSQLDATVMGIARALSAVDKSHRAVLKKKGLLTRDSRIRERRKVGMGGKSRRKRQSPKR